MNDVRKPMNGASSSVKVARVIALISSVDINTRLTLCFVLIIGLMSVGTGILLWQSHVMRTQANRLKEVDEQFMEVQRVHALVLSFRNESEQLVKAQSFARLQQKAPALRNQLNDSLGQTRTLFRGIEPNNILDPTVLPTLETIQGLLPSQIDSLTTLASVADWEALRQRMEQPLEPLENLSAELVDTASRHVQEKRSEAARQIERAQNRIVFILAGIGGLTIIAASLLGFAITQSITGPLRSLVDAASTLARGEFGHHIPVQGRDELAHVSRVFNQTTLVLRQLYENLRRSEQELRDVIDTIPSLLWSTSPTGEPTHLSQRLLDYYGYSFDEFVSRGWERFIHPDDREETAKAFARAINSGESYSVINRLRRADGEYRWHHTMGEPLRDPQGKIVQWYGLSVDIDERKRAEDHLRETRLKLSKASRIATVAELSASIAHELNQPLMAVLANAQAAKRWLAADPPNLTETNTSIDRILRDTRTADETMKHIRALFKQESFNKREANIAEIISEAIRLVQEDPYKREIPIVWYFDEGLSKVSVDPIQIQEVFINLISNAIEAMEGNRLPPLIKVRAAVTKQNEMLVQVIDNGPGVRDKEKIFDAFVTTKGKGMGIGLAVSRSIVEAHGGRLWAENDLDGGATFSIALPLTSQSLRDLFD